MTDMLQGIPPGPRRALTPIVYLAGIAATFLVGVLGRILAAMCGTDTKEYL